MASGGAGERPFELGDWRVEPARGVIAPLAGAGAETRLEPKLMDLLLLFAGSGGRVLSKDEIVDGVWAGRAIGDDTLAAAMSRLRRALGETAERRYIETLPKRGYRLLLGPVGSGAAGAEAAAAPGGAAELVAKGAAALASPLGQPQARLYFEAAVTTAPAWAPAHAGLAEALIGQQLAGGDPVLLAAAKAEARSATVLDEGLAAGWAALGLALLLADRDFPAADEALRRAIALDPELASARRHRAVALASVGRFAEAERESRKALALEPVSLAAHSALLQVLICARRYWPAIAAASAALALAPGSSEGWYGKGWALVLAGDEAAGVEALMKGLQLWGLDAEALASLQGAYARGGFPALCAAGADLFETQHLLFTPKITDIALLRAAAGDPDRAFAALEIAVSRDDPWLMLLPWLPHLDALRADPRFQRLLGRVRLVT